MKDLLGKRFGKLTVIKFVWYNKYHCTEWECKCDCWKLVTRNTSHLLETEKKWFGQSCWCGRRKANLMPWTKFYRKYVSMRARCEKEYADSYKTYWAKGIRCERKKFSDFYNDMYDSYIEHCKCYGEKNTTIDRIDNSKNYCKENCRWATLKEQANNKTNNVVLEYKWERLNISQWADRIWITFSTLYQRLYKWMDLAFIIENPNIKSINEYKKIEDCNEQLKKYI